MITIPYITALTTYFSYGLLFAFGQLRDFFRRFVDWWSHSSLQVNIHSCFAVYEICACVFFFFLKIDVDFVFLCDGRATRRSVWGLRISTFGDCICEFRFLDLIWFAFRVWSDWNCPVWMPTCCLSVGFYVILKSNVMYFCYEKAWNELKTWKILHMLWRVEMLDCFSTVVHTSNALALCRIVLTDQYQALLMLGLMWWSVSPTTITKRFSNLLF